MPYDPIPFEDLPASTVAYLKIVKGKGPHKNKVAAWKDVPPDWGIHKACGAAWFPKHLGCLYCGGDE